MAVPYTFSTATGSLPLSQLDSNFSTAITIGNTAVVLGDSITTINNLTLANVAITSVSTAFPNGYLANSNVIVGTTTLTLGSTVTSINGLSLSNVTISSGNVTISNVTTTNVTATTANVTTANVGTLVVIGNTTAGGNVTITGNVSAANGTFTSANISGTSNISTLVVTGTSALVGVATLTANPVLSAGTANGVTYLNGSKSLTSGSALTFDGTTLTVTGTETLTSTSAETKFNITNTGTGGIQYWIGSTNNSSGAIGGGRLAFYDQTSNAARMVIDNAGNVGIGTASPSTYGKFVVAGGDGNTQFNVGTNGVLRTAGYNSTYSGASLESVNVAQSGYLPIAINGSYTVLATGGTERMRIDSSGNVGIGVTPTANFGLLQVNTATNGTAAYLGNGAGVHGFNSTGYYSSAVTLSSAGTWTARSTASGIVSSTNSGTILFYTDTGLTSGNTFTPTERMRIDTIGNAQFQTGAVMPYAPAPTGIAAATTLTNAQIQGQIISATGTTYTITMALGTTLETLATWATTNIAYDFFVINTASGIITMAVNTGVTSLGSLTVAIGASAHFRIRRTAANTFVLYRLV